MDRSCKPKVVVVVVVVARWTGFMQPQIRDALSKQVASRWADGALSKELDVWVTLFVDSSLVCVRECLSEKTFSGHKTSYRRLRSGRKWQANALVQSSRFQNERLSEHDLGLDLGA